MSRLQDRIFKHYTEIMEFLRKLNERGVTVVMITHDMHLMLEYTPRALVFSDGQLIADRSAAAVLCDPELIEQCRAERDKSFYTGKPLRDHTAGGICRTIYRRRQGGAEAMAAKTVLNYLPRRQRSTQDDRNYQAGIFPAVYVRKHDHL